MHPARYLPLLRVLTALTLLSLSIHTLGEVAYGPFPRPLFLRDPPLSTRLLDTLGARLSGLERDLHHSPLPIHLFLGSSSVGMGLQRPLLDKLDAGRARWILLSYAGGSFTYTGALPDLLEGSPLSFHTIVLGVHPVQALERLPPPSDFPLAQRLLSTPWIRKQGNRIREEARRPLRRLHFRLLRACGSDRTAVRYAPDPDPWALNHFEFVPRHNVVEGQALTNQLESFEKFDFGNPSHYSPDAPPLQVLLEILPYLRSKCERLVLLLMPESPELRRGLPPTARSALLDTIRLGCPDALILDMAEAVPEQLMFDCFHIDSPGRTPFTREFHRRLQATHLPQIDAEPHD